MPTIPQTGEILVDRSASGRERPWRDKRLGAERVAAAYRALGKEGKAARTKGCGTTLAFAECPTDGYKRLRHANFCRERLCPMCAWRRTLKLTAEVGKVIHAAAERHPRRAWVMLTLTQRNVSGDALPGEVDRILRGWTMLSRRKDLRGVVGWLRVLEVTHNATANEWHPHIHALLLVRSSYFSGRDYVPQRRWRELWGEVLELDYLPVVEVHRVRDRGGSRDKLQSVALEAGKYTVKDSDLLGDTPDDDVERIRVLDAALRGRRLIAWGGELRAIAKEMTKDSPPEEEDLVNVGDEPHHHGDTCPICGSQMLEHVYRWIRSIRYYVG